MSGARDPGSTFAAVPVKDLFGTKSRLAPLLDPGGRAGLTLYMMKHVLSVLQRAGLPSSNLCVVSPDRLVLETAAGAGAVPLLQSTSGLNPALEEARLWSVSQGAASLLVLPADLPLLRSEDVEAMLSTGDESPVTMAPDAGETGTNALLLEPPDAIPFLFGLGSYQAHLDASRRRGLDVSQCRLPNLSFDVDTVEGLTRLEEAENPSPIGGTPSPGESRF